MTADSGPVALVLGRLDGFRPNAGGYMARCPSHEDRQASLSISEGDDGRALLWCFAGCKWEAVTAALGLLPADLFPPREAPISAPPPRILAAPRPTNYAIRDTSGNVVAVHVRQDTPTGKDITWQLPDGTLGLNGTPIADLPLFGSQSLPKWDTSRPVLVVEGEKAAYALREADFRSLGTVTGAASAPSVAVLEALRGHHVILWPDADDAGRQHMQRIAERLEGIAASLRLLTWPDAPEHGDAADLLRAGSSAEVETLIATAEPLPAWRPLAADAHILDRFADEIEAAGLAGERRLVKLLYLVLTSRLLARIVSIALKGPSSVGKSFLVDRTLAYFPPSAYFALSAMSEHAMAYSTEPLKHRMLVLYEAAGMNSDLATYLIRSLLSEGQVRYETVQRGTGGLEPKLIVREGPTGLIVTTTEVRLHPENETRLLSLTVTDSPEQTKAVLLAQAGELPETDVRPWQALQQHLASLEQPEVDIPYATELASLIPPVAVRLRRDFPAVLALIRAHALLHEASRQRDERGRIVAELVDYAAVRELVADLVAEAAERTVSATVRETVRAVADLVATSGATKETTMAAVGQRLGLDKSAAWRRVRVAMDRGYLRNQEEKKGRPARLVLGDALPEDAHILPEVERLQGCTPVGGGREQEATAAAVAPLNGGSPHAPSLESATVQPHQAE